MTEKMRVNVFLIVFLVSMLLLTFNSTVLADDSTSWAVQTVDIDGAGGNGICPIVVDSNNNPHIFYSGINPPTTYDTVMYASWNGSGWTTQTIEEYNTAYSIVLDAEDNPHISFRALYKNTYYYYHDYIMYATATINAELSEPLSTSSDFNLLLILAIVISATTVTVVYVWKKYKYPPLDSICA